MERVRFSLFILVNAALYLRPPELVESWKEVKVYEPLILACLAASVLELLTYLFGSKLRQQPITILILALRWTITEVPYRTEKILGSEMLVLDGDRQLLFLIRRKRHIRCSQCLPGFFF